MREEVYGDRCQLRVAVQVAKQGAKSNLCIHHDGCQHLRLRRMLSTYMRVAKRSVPVL